MLVWLCLERGADLHMAQLMPLPLTVFCFSKIQIGFAFLVPTHPGSPRQMAVKRVCVSGYILKKNSRRVLRDKPYNNPRDHSDPVYPSTSHVASSLTKNRRRAKITRLLIEFSRSIN